jgi:hypothetical protein
MVRPYPVFNRGKAVPFFLKTAVILKRILQQRFLYTVE